MGVLPSGGPPAGRVALVALGSNVGDRHGHLAAARAQIAILPGTTLLAASAIEETAPLGGARQPAYLNQMVAVRTSLPAGELLDALHAIERLRGRERRERWGPRTLDLDIVEIEGESRSDGPLLLPHPGLPERDFWQRERAELRSIMLASHPVAPPGWNHHGDTLHLPRWAVAGDDRRAHIERVTRMLEGWAAAMAVDEAERSSWRDAGRLHDALRDADETYLRAIVSHPGLPAAALHGPAAAALLEADGEERSDVLEAVRCHTLGSDSWSRTGRALYMADYLEPGRSFSTAERAALASQVPSAFDATFAEVVRRRIVRAIREGRDLHPATLALWETVQ